MLRTKPRDTRFSISCQVVSNDMVVSISRTPSSPNALPVVPTPEWIQKKQNEPFQEPREFFDFKSWPRLKYSIEYWTLRSLLCVLKSNIDFAEWLIWVFSCMKSITKYLEIRKFKHQYSANNHYMSLILLKYQLSIFAIKLLCTTSFSGRCTTSILIMI